MYSSRESGYSIIVRTILLSSCSMKKQLSLQNVGKVLLCLAPLILFTPAPASAELRKSVVIYRYGDNSGYEPPKQYAKCTGVGNGYTRCVAIPGYVFWVGNQERHCYLHDKRYVANGRVGHSSSTIRERWCIRPARPGEI